MNTTNNQPPDLSKVSDKEILFGLTRLCRTERKITQLVLLHIIEVDNRKLYLQLGHDSLKNYLVKEQGYADNAAYDRINAARVLKQNPEVTKKLESGSLNLSQLVKVSHCLKQSKKAGEIITQQTTESILKQIENKSVFETEKVCALELNITPEVHQKIKPQKDNSIRLEVTLTEEQYEILKKAQSLLSHVVYDNSLADVITYLAKSHIKKIEGKSAIAPKSEIEKKAIQNENRINREQKINTEQKTRQVDISTEIQSELKTTTQSLTKMPFRRRKYISVKTKRALYQRANHTCEYVHPTGQRCHSQYQLQIDHIQALALGGSNEIHNLRVLCGVHNRMEARRYGLSRPLL